MSDFERLVAALISAIDEHGAPNGFTPQGLADLIRNRRINGRWQPFSSIRIEDYSIEYRPELPEDGRYELTWNGAHLRRLYTIEDCILEIAELSTGDIDSKILLLC